jgi:methionine-rich copper-binding protein CopC
MAAFLRRAALTVFAAAAAVLGFAAPASAHNFYVSSTPGIDETLTTLPDEFVVTTNDNLLDLGGNGNGFIIQVAGPDGLYYGDGCVTVSGPSVAMPAALGPAGDYLLTWQVISTDGHTVSGEVPFQWQPAADADTSTSGSATPPDCGRADAPPAPEEGTDAGAGQAGSMTDVLWIGGAVLAVLIAVGATLLLLRPRRR